MTTIIWVPGLQGERSLSQNFGLGANGLAVQNIARQLKCSFIPTCYQSTNSPNLLLSVMGQRLAAAIRVVKQDPIIIVGSSVGAGVALDALSRLKSCVSPIALIAFKPVPDPLMATSLQLTSEALAALNAGQISVIPMPVESTDGQPQDTFPLTKAHLDDPNALRLLSNPDHVARFNESAGGRAVRTGSIIYARGDHLTPEAMMMGFRDAVHNTRLDMIALDGNHGTDFTTVLNEQVREMVVRLG